MSKLKEQIVSEIKKIYDPEIPVNIYELGLIYKIEIKEEKKWLRKKTSLKIDKSEPKHLKRATKSCTIIT